MFFITRFRVLCSGLPVANSLFWQSYFLSKALGFLVLASETVFSEQNVFSQHHRIRLSLVMPHLQHFLRHPPDRRYWGIWGNLGEIKISLVVATLTRQGHLSENPWSQPRSVHNWWRPKKGAFLKNWSLVDL